MFSSAIVPICCSNCGSEIGRKYDGRMKENKVSRVCENSDCNRTYRINDLDLRKMIRDKLAVISEISSNTSDEISCKIRRLENEIERDLLTTEIDEKIVKNKIFECAVLQYSQYQNPKGSIDFSEMNLCSLNFNREVKRRVKVVYLENDNKIWLLMNDGQIVGKDVVENECYI